MNAMPASGAPLTVRDAPVDGERIPARQRLMEAFAAAVATKGYAATTIADIVAFAKVSKRTFYQCFADKEDCLLAVYEYVCTGLMDLLRSAATGERPWPERVRAATSGYLAALEALPAVSRTLLLEIQAAGPRAFHLRKQMQQSFAEVLRELVEVGRREHPDLRPLSPALAVALVGGINELLLHAVDPYQPADPQADPRRPFTSLTDAVVELVSAVLTYRPG